MRHIFQALPPILLRVGPADLPAPAEGADAARRRAEEILSREEFLPPPRSLLSRLLDLLARAFQRLVEGVGSDNAVLAWFMVAGMALVAVGLLFLAARAVQRDPVARAGVVVDGVGRPPSEWRADAARHEAVQAWREALRCHWRALVADLAARGLVEEVPGRTSGEYRHQVARSVPGAARSFSGATSLFEAAWYAAEDVDEADVAEERRLGGEVLAEATR